MGVIVEKKEDGDVFPSCYSADDFQALFFIAFVAVGRAREGVTRISTVSRTRDTFVRSEFERDWAEVIGWLNMTFGLRGGVGGGRARWLLPNPFPIDPGLRFVCLARQ